MSDYSLLSDVKNRFRRVMMAYRKLLLITRVVLISLTLSRFGNESHGSTLVSEQVQ